MLQLGGIRYIFFVTISKYTTRSAEPVAEAETQSKYVMTSLTASLCRASLVATGSDAVATDTVLLPGSDLMFFVETFKFGSFGGVVVVVALVNCKYRQYTVSTAQFTHW